MSTVLHFQGTQFKSCTITTKVVLFFTTFGTGSLCCSWRILKSNVTVWWPLLLIKTFPKTALCMMFCSFSSHELICTSYFDHALVKAPNNIFFFKHREAFQQLSTHFYPLFNLGAPIYLLFSPLNLLCSFLPPIKLLVKNLQCGSPPPRHPHPFTGLSH